jgi:chromosome segregation ATPase
MKDYAELIKGQEIELKDAEKREVEKQDVHKALVSTLREQQATAEKLQQELQAAQAAAHKKKMEVHDSVSEIQQVKNEIIRLQKDLSDLHREKKIMELIAKQTPFWEVLETRIDQRRKDMTFGLEGIGGEEKSTKDVIERIQHIAQGGGFNRQAADCRAGESIYTQYIKKICEMTVDGATIGYELKQERIDIIDRFLNQPTVRNIWS